MKVHNLILPHPKTYKVLFFRELILGSGWLIYSTHYRVGILRQ